MVTIAVVGRNGIIKPFPPAGRVLGVKCLSPDCLGGGPARPGEVDPLLPHCTPTLCWSFSNLTINTCLCPDSELKTSEISDKALITTPSPSRIMATPTTGTFSVGTRNESFADIIPASSSSTTTTPHVNTVNIGTSITVGRDQYNNTTYQTIYYSNTSQNMTAGPSPSSAVSFNDAPLGLLSAHFAGRQHELAQMIKALEVVRGDVLTRFGVYAGPGVGKSQLTLALAKESFAQGRYKCIFWIPATTVEKLHQGFSKLLHLVGHPDRSDSEETVKLTAARRWLENFTCGKWLLVLDNVVLETVNFLREHLPRKNNHGNILFTTRTKDIAMALAHTSSDRHEILELRIPNKGDAGRLLLGHFTEGEIDGDESKVQEVVRCVGYLPLAIAQAAAYMRQTGSTLDALLNVYNSEQKIDMMKWENNLSTYQEKSVAATFTYQLDDLQHHFPDVSNLLKVIAYFDPESIPLNMLIIGANVISNSQLRTAPDSIASAPQKTTSLLGKVKTKLIRSYKGKGKGRADESNSTHTASAELSSLLALIQSPMGLPNAIAQLQNRSLIKQQGTSQSSSLWLHDLTQLIVLDNTKKGGVERKWFEIAVELACSAFEQVQDPEFTESWREYETLVPHIQALTIRQEISGDANHSLLLANSHIAEYWWSRGRYDDAEVQYKQVLSSQEKQLGPEHVDTVHTMNSLGEVYHYQGRYTDAEAVFKQILSSSERQFGPEHLNTVTIMNNLAVTYKFQGRYDDAEMMFVQVISCWEKQLGSDHVNTLSAMDNLAGVYKLQQRYWDAEVLYKRVLSSREKLLGPEHMRTLTTKSGLASVYCSQARYVEAEALLVHILATREKRLGISHPDTQRSQRLLAKVNAKLGRLDDAEKMTRSVSPSPP